MLHWGAARRGSELAKKDYESRTEALIQPLIDENHFELVDVEWVKEGANWYLRVSVSYTHLTLPTKLEV